MVPQRRMKTYRRLPLWLHPEALAALSPWRGPTYSIPERIARIRLGALQQLQTILSGEWKSSHKNLTQAFEEAMKWVEASYVEYEGPSSDPLLTKVRRIRDILRRLDAPFREGTPLSQERAESLPLFQEMMKKVKAK